jgi:hypothetical protein
MSASTSLPSAIVAIVALALVGRRRAAWLAAVPAQGFMLAALVVAALELRVAGTLGPRLGVIPGQPEDQQG